MTPRTISWPAGLLVAALTLGACGGEQAPKAAPTPTPTSSPTVSPSPSMPPAPETEWVLYLQDQGAEEPRLLYRARLDGSSRSRIAGNVQRDWVFEPSRDGRFVLAWHKQWIGVMAASGTAFATIAQEKRAAHSFRAAILSGDSSAVAYVLTHDLDPGNPAGARDNSLYVAPREGGSPRLVRTFRTPAYVALTGFDSARGLLWWYETGEGGFFRNLTEVRVADGNARILPGAPGGETSGMQTTADSKLGFMLSEDRQQIVEYSLETETARVVYTIESPGKDAHGNPSGIMRFAVAPDGSRIVFSIVHEPSDKEITYSLWPKTGTATVVLDDPKRYNVGAQSISPEARYVWLETDCHGCGDERGYNNQGEYYLLDLSDGSSKTFMRIPRQNGIVEQGIRFVGWLAG